MLTTFIQDVKRLSSVLKKAFPLVGIAILMTYTIRIGFVPQGISVGDGFLMAAIAVCFSCIYSLLLFFSYMCGRSYFFIISLFFKAVSKIFLLYAFLSKNSFSIVIIFVVCFISCRWRNKTDEVKKNIPTLGGVEIFLGLLFICCILYFSLAHLNFSNGLYVITIPLVVYFAVILFFAVKIELEKKYDKDDIKNKSENRVIVWGLILVIFFYTIEVNPFSGMMIDKSMVLARIRMENVSMYVKKNTAEAIYLSAKSANIFLKECGGKEYCEFTGVNILLKGIGQELIIELADNGKTIIMAVPSQDTIVRR